MIALTGTQCRWLAVGLLLVLFAQLATSAVVKSPTFDEPLHAARSYVVLATGDWRMQAGHLPLVHRLIGPVFWLLSPRPDPRALSGWSPLLAAQLAREILQGFDLHLDALIFPPRLVVMGLALLLGALLYRWAEQRHGPTGGLLAALAYTFSPNILAHGRLVTTDLALACFSFLAVYAFERWLVQPTVGRFVIAGLALGLALGCKVSALLLLPVFALLSLARSGGLGEDQPKRPRGSANWLQQLVCRAVWLVLAILLALLVVWLLYGLEIGRWAEQWPALPLSSYVKSVLQVREHGGARGHPAFLMGRRSGGGWPQYFPIALALKTPLPTLIGALAGSVWLLWRRRWWAVLSGILPPVVFLAAAVFSSLNIGYRHILVIVPFLILQLAALAEIPRHRTTAAVPILGLALWLVAGTLGIHPDYLAYFNELAGGPGEGHRYLTDSNLDWGQDLIQLRDYLEARGIETISLSYFGNVDPTEYGIQYTPLPSHFSLGEVEGFTPFAPAPGFYAISVTNLTGQYLVEDPSVLDWFNHQTPITSIGHSINVYHVSPDRSPPTWVGICRAPGTPLDSKTFTQNVGRDNLRFVHFDCRSSWVFADGGQPAWFVVPATDQTRGIAPPLGAWGTVYEQENYGGKRLFTIYRWDGRDLQARVDALRTDPQVTPPLPVDVGGCLALLGYEAGSSAARAGDEVSLTTYWRVLSQPDQPLSLLAHLVDQEGRPVAIGDALGVPIEGWASGDIIVQAHRLSLGSAVAPGTYRLQTGAYWLPGVDRLPVFDEEGKPLAGHVIPLTTIHVEAAS